MKTILLHILGLTSARFITEEPLKRSVRYDDDVHQHLLDSSEKDQLFSNTNPSEHLRNLMPSDEPYKVQNHIEIDNIKKSQYAVAEIFFHSSDGPPVKIVLYNEDFEQLRIEVKSIYQDHGMEWIEPDYPRKINLKVSIVFDNEPDGQPSRWNKDVEHIFNITSAAEADEMDQEFRNKWKSYFNEKSSEHNIGGSYKFGRSTQITQKTSRRVKQPRRHHNHHNVAPVQSSSSQDVNDDRKIQQELCSAELNSMRVKNQCMREKKKLNLPHMHHSSCRYHCSFIKSNGVWSISDVIVTARPR